MAIMKNQPVAENKATDSLSRLTHAAHLANLSVPSILEEGTKNPKLSCIVQDLWLIVLK